MELARKTIEQFGLLGLDIEPVMKTVVADIRDDVAKEIEAKAEAYQELWGCYESPIGLNWKTQAHENHYNHLIELAEEIRK